jgi:predicted ATPase/DNA-binding CsgD family transcriptional regulator
MFVGQESRQQGQLPVETTGFVGRESELTRLSVLLGRARLVTVTGPGGVGKTRLALRAAAKAAPGFADGARLVELSALREPDLLVDTVARALGLPGPGRGSSPDPVLAYLADRQLLLILDTCEHLVDACAMLAEAVIARAPRVTMLATSREPLDISGENACPVPPLPVPELDGLAADPAGQLGDARPGGVRAGDPLTSDARSGQAWPAGELRAGPVTADQPAARDPQEAREAGRTADYRGTAVELFIQRASAAVPGFSPGPGDLVQVARLCRRLDGMPLAIELAAVRLRALPLAELASRLDQSLALLTTGRGARHRSLREAVSWSHALCTPAEQAMWARLSVFAGPFTMQAAEEVCAGHLDPGQAMPTLIRLVDKSVLVRIDPADSGGQPTQYHMLGSIREFGAEQLAGTDAETPARNRLIARYLAMARYFRDHFADDDQLALLAELSREHASLRAALEYALGDQARPGRRAWQADCAADGVQLATALGVYWRARCLIPEGTYWLGRAVERAPAGSAARARALLALAHLLTAQGRAAEAAATAAAALEIAAGLGDEMLTARGFLVSTGALRAAGRLPAAAESAEQARARLTALDDQLGLVHLDIQLTYLSLLGDDVPAALGHVEHGLRQLGRSRERWLHASLYLVASLTLYRAGRDIEATWTATRALEVKHEIGDTLGTAFALEVLGWLAARSGSHQRAAWLLGSAEPLWERAGGRFAVASGFERRRDEVVAACAGALGDRRFAELFARGAAQPLEEAVSFALHDGAGPVAEGGAKIRLPGQLTAREREIASFVAAGLSNRQIAERLFISRRTVDAHLEHIFGKLGITSRVMLTIQLREYSAEPAEDANA